MNENTAKLLEQLAQKLGTTSEYLWSILIKQAPVDATVTLIQAFLTILFGLFLWKTHKRLMKKETNDGYTETGYGKYEELAAIPMIIGTLIFVLFFCAAFLCIGDVFNGYFNPEYWALDKILDKIKK